MRGRHILFLSLFVITIVAIAGIPTESQYYEIKANQDHDLIAGRNVNMVSGMTLPDGDPWLQRQNEPSIAVSTRNPLHLLAGANDYRTVDLPFSEGELPGQLQNQATGDAWLGVFKSFDGGQSWKSTLLDGYPQGPNNPPLFGYQAAADPVVRAGANGLFYYSGIVFDRTATENNAVFVARFIDNNNDEEGDSIQYIDTKIVDEMNGGRFKDKPWIAVSIPKKNAKTIDIDGQNIPRSNVYIVYSVFKEVDGTQQSEILFRRSTNCGNSWEEPIVLSSGHYLNQGATIAVDPRDNGHIYVAWRRFDSSAGATAQSDAIVVARSTNEGKEFPEVIEVTELPGPFDQPTSSASFPLPGTAFRTNSYPTMAIDSKGRIYLAWAQRGVDPVYPDDSRVVIATSKDGFVWTTPMTVESAILSANGSDCHEFMPSIAFAGGRLILAWYDTRNDYCPDISPWWICDSGDIRHTVDVRVAQGTPAEFPVFRPSVQVSRYLWAMWEGSSGNYYFSQVQFNPPNYPLFKGGTVPFHGDYIEIAPSPSIVLSSKGVWRFNTEPTDSQQFHLAWTDNRDVRPPSDNDWTIYNAPNSSQSFFQSQFIAENGCDPERTGMRNQNIYTSLITSVMEAGSPGNNKPLGTLGTNPATGEMIPRAFVIFIKNPTEDIRHYRLQITDGTDHGTASFLEFDMLEEIDVSIAPYSSISRPLFVTSSDENDTVTVDVFEIDEPGGFPVDRGARSTIIINPDETNPDVTGDLATTETHDPDIANPNIVNWTYVNPNIVNPNIVNTGIQNPNIVNPNIVNPNIVNPNIVNPNIVNPNIVNPNIVNPNIVNPNIVNPNIVNPSIADADVTDIEWPVRNNGNTISSYTFKIFARESLPRGIYAQLLVYKVHYTPAIDGIECKLQQTPHHELLLNIINPNIVNPNIVNPNIVNPNIVNSAIENATFFLSPGDEAKAVLRLIDPDPGVSKFLQSGRKFKIHQFAESLDAAAGSQAVDSEDAKEGDTTAEADSTDLIITTSGLPDGTVGEVYPSVAVPYVVLEAAGGDGPYVWYVDSENLPPGLGFSNDGIISGIPQEDPNATYPKGYSFLVQVSSGGDIDTQNLIITINSAEEPNPPLNIETTTLPPGTVGNYYGFTLQATGGVSPRNWSKASGTLPLGLTLDSAGVISGTIVEDENVSYPHDYTFDVQVTDANTDTDTQPLSITVSDIVYPDLTISGTITDGYGSAVQGVNIYGLPHAPQTDSYGFYSDTVPHGWSGTITPFKAGYNFQVSTQDPFPSRTYTEITADQYGQDFVADTINYIISGTVTYYGSPLAGVTMNGLPGTPVTNASGYYSAPVPHGWSGTVTPELLDYIFDPPNRTYASITSDHVNQYYVATFVGVGQDDPFEENDDLNSAADITAGTYTNMQLHDDDWYGVNVAEGLDLKVFVDGDLSNNIDVEIHDSLGNRIVGAYGDSQDATAFVSDLVAGWYYIRVIYLGTSGFWNSYSLTVETGDITTYGDITGRVTNISTDGIQNVEIWSYDTQSEHYFITTTDANGDYRISLPPSVYKLKFDASSVTPENYVSEFYESKYTYDDANEVLLQAGDLIGGVDAQLEEGSILAITTTSLPNGNVANSYSVTLEAFGGITPYNWNLAPGPGPLPNGLNLHGTGLLDGIPTTTGTFDFTIQVTDSSSPTPQADERAFSVTIGSADTYPEGMISYWKFDEGDGSSAYDSFDTNHGTIFGAIWSPGQVNDALSFVDDYVSVGDFAGYSDNVSVEAWIRTPGSGGVDNWDDIVCGPVGDIIFGISGNRLNFAGQGGTPIDHNTWSTTTLDDNEWHHVAGTYDGSQVCVYVDGQQEACNPASGSFTPGFKSIGRGDYDGEYFNGIIDEVAIYNRALSPLEVEQHYQNGLNGLGYEEPGGGLTIITTSLPDGYVATQYFAQIEATGGIEPYSWSLAPGSDPLPAGLEGDENTAIIEGIPTVAGTYNLILQVTDSSPTPQTVTQPLSITIHPYAGTGYSISGTITDNGSPVPGVEMAGLPGNPLTNEQGEYNMFVYPGWSGTVTPILVGFAFDPASRTYINVVKNYPGEVYTASAGFAISGEVTFNGSPLPGVLMSGLPGDPRTNESGQYTGAVPSGWTGTVAPTLPGFTFSPTDSYYPNVISNETQGYTASFAGGQDDIYEENDNVSIAAELTLGTHTNLVLSDADWFRVYVGAGDVGKDLKVNVKGTSYPEPNGNKDLDFYILDSSEKMLGYVLSSSDDETLYLTDIEEGWYYIGQTYISQPGTVYSITLEVSDNFGIGYISGRVTDEQTGQGIEGIYVELYGDPFDWGIPRPFITTDANGEYKVGYTPGNYTVRFNLQNFYYRDPYALDLNYIGETYNWNEVFSVVAGTTIEGIDAELERGGTVTGRVTDPGGNGVDFAAVSICKNDISRVSFARTDENGYYTADRMQTGNYKVRFQPSYYQNYGTQWYDDTGSFGEGHPVAVQQGAITPDINAQLEETGYIQGRVTNNLGNPIQNVIVRVYDAAGYIIVSRSTDENGDYYIDDRLPEGDVIIFFDAINAPGNYASEYYTDKLLIEEADPVSVQAGQTTFGIDAELVEGGTITGRVTDAQGYGFSGVGVACFDADSERYHAATSDENGNYTLPNLPPDGYYVRFRAGIGNYAMEWYDDKGSSAEGEVISVGTGQTSSGIDAQLADNGGFVSGRVEDIYGNGIADVYVWVRDIMEGSVYSSVFTDADGNYTAPKIPTCNAKVFFNSDYGYLNYVAEYYNDKGTYESADLVAATLGLETPGINAVLAPISPVSITTTSLPSGEVAVPYSQTLEVTGGREFYYWSVISGNVPPGLTLNSKGEISGIPNDTGTYNFTVRVTDSSRNQLVDTQTLSITIDAYAGTGYLISGAVTSGGSPLGGVVLQGLPGNPATNSSGEYTVYVYSGWSGTVTPTLSGYAFDPASRIYNNVAANIPGENYTASTGYSISGEVTLVGLPLEGVLISGLPTNPYTDVNGQYSGAVPSGWSGAVTPTLPGFSFNPTNLPYTNVTSDQPGQNYTANFQGGQDDIYENNDDVSSAAEITFGTYANLVLADEDWFKIHIPAGNEGKDLKINMKAQSYPDASRGGDLDFAVLDESEKMLGYVLSSSDDETLYITDVTEGYYYIGQYYIGQPETVYSLTVEISDNFGIGYVSGRVTDEQTGQGIEGVYVELYGQPFDWDNSRPLITTDENGEYKVGYIPGFYTVRFNLESLSGDPYAQEPNYIGKTYNSNQIFSVAAGATIDGIDAELLPGGAITGRITNPWGNDLENGIGFAYVYSSDYRLVSFSRTDANGYYSAKRIPTGNYKVRLRGDNYAQEFYENTGSLGDGHPVSVQAGSTTPNIDGQLDESAYIEGRVTDSSQNPIQNVIVYAYDLSGIALSSSRTNDDGYYWLGWRLPTGDVKLYFSASGAGGNYASEYYTDKLLIEDADPISVQSGQTTSNIDAVLAEGGRISGRVTDAQDDGFPGVAVHCIDIDSDRFYSATTDADGYYTIGGLKPDDYKVRFRTTFGDYATQWYNGGFSFSEGSVVSVAPGADLTNIKAQLTNNGGFITGRVTDMSGNGVKDVQVIAQDAALEAAISWTISDSDGYYTIPRIPTCQAKVCFDADLNFLNYVSEWYDNSSTHAGAGTVAVTFGQTTPGINAVLAPIPPVDITTTSLSNGEVAAPYEAILGVTGGREFYHWSLISGSLPPGLMLNSKGEITGTPTASGTYNFTVRVTDSSRNQQLIDTQILSLMIDAYAGTGYLISGSVTSGGSPLGGVVLQGLPGNPVTSPNGEYIIAVPQSWSGTVTPTLSGYYFDPTTRDYTDVDSNLPGQDYTAYELTLQITTEWLLNGTEEYPYNQSLSAEGGTEPYTWTLSSGSLPYGLTLNSNGTISGTPTQPDNYDFTVRVTDSNTPVSQYVEKNLNINIHWDPTSEGPILYWKLDEGDGTVAQDSSGYNDHGTLMGNVAYTTDAFDGHAAEILANGWLERSYQGPFHFVNQAMIMARVKIDFSQQNRFVWKLQYDEPHRGHPYSLEVSLDINGSMLHLDSGNGLIQDIFNCPHFQIDVDLTSTGFDPLQYNQIAVTINGDVYKIFINGIEIASATGAPFEVHDSIQHFWVGGADWSEYWLGGKIDEILVFNMAYGPQEVNDIYSMGVLPTISGTVHLSDGSPLPWVRMNGLAGNPQVQEDGTYIGVVSPNWSGTVTPDMGGYFFNPPSRTYENVTSNRTGEDYTAYEQGSLWIETDWLPDGTKNQSYSTTLMASDGVPDYTWSVVSGSLPTGLTLNSNGEISGTPTEAGDFSFMVRVLDSHTPPWAAEQYITLFISAAHQGFWSTTYPFGGNMHSTGLALDYSDPDVIFASAGNRGIYHSIDAAASWNNIIEDPSWPYGETDYQYFLIHQGSGNYYTCTGFRIYRSTNSGETWEQIYETEDWDISTITIDPTSAPASIIYVGTWEGEMFKTTDGGANWSPIGSGLPTEEITIITVDPNTPATLYAGTNRFGIYKSTDGGASWLPTNGTTDFSWIEDIEIGPAGNIYVMAWTHEHGGGVFKSTDAGATWARMNNAYPGWNPGNSIAIDPTDPDVIYSASYGSVFKSIDAGNSWFEYTVSSVQTEGIIINPASPQILYTATAGEGVWKSNDGGQTWAKSSNGIRALGFPHDDPHSLEIDETNPNYIYSGSINGGYRSTNGGSSWEKMDHPSGSILALLTHPSATGNVYSYHNSLDISTTNGSSGSWITAPGFMWNFSRGDIGIAADDPNIIYVGTWGSDTDPTGVYKTTNGGTTFTLMNTGLDPSNTEVQTIAVHPGVEQGDHDIVLIGLRREWPFEPGKDYGLYKTTDGGNNWYKITDGIPGDLFARQIVFDPVDHNIMYMVGETDYECGVYKSTDGGEHWWHISWHCGNTIAVNPNNPAHLYMGSWEGFYVSLDGGNSWMQFNDGLPPNPHNNRTVHSIALDPNDPLHVFIGTAAGVYEATFAFDFMITTENLPTGIVAESYSTYIEVAGGTPPITWEMVSGELPEGLTFNETMGEISGTPLETGYWEITIKATDGGGNSYTKRYDLNISNKYFLTVGTNPQAGGSVDVDPDEPWYIEGSMVDVSVTINPGYVFTGWSGDATGRATVVHVEMTRDKTLTANFATPGSLPDYAISSFNAPGSASAGDVIGGSVSAEVRNQGAADPYTGDISVGIYLSSDPVITTSDILLWKGRSSIAALSGGTTNVPIAPDLQIPTTVSSGSYYIGVLVDEFDVIAEQNEDNNHASQAITITSTAYDHLEFLGMWRGGESNAVACDEARNLALIGHGALLQVLDVSDPSHPIKIGEVALGTRGISDIKILGTTAYVAGDGFRIVDVSSPTSPIEIGHNDSPYLARGVVVSGNYAYVTDHFHQGLRVFNISDPSNPNQVRFAPFPGRTRGIAISGNTLYLAAGVWLEEGETGIRVVNITDPTNPVEGVFYPTSAGTGWPEISGDYLYLPTSGGGLHVLNISDAANPSQVAIYSGVQNSGWIKVVGDYAYINDNNRNAVAVLNISDVNNVYEEGVYHFEDQTSINYMDVLGNHCYADGWYNALKILDMSNPSNPVKLGSYDFEGLLREVDVSEDFAFMTTYNERGVSRFKSLAISSLPEVTEVGVFHNFNDMFRVRISGNFAYAVTDNRELKVLDISDPSNPHEVAVYDNFDNIYDLEVAGNYAYVLDYFRGLQVIDVSSPANPVFVSQWYTNPRSYRLAISGNYAYVSALWAGVRIIDISDPMNPWEVGFYQTQDLRAYELEASGNYVYVEDVDYNVRIIDVSDPQNPVEVGKFVTEVADISDIEVSGHVVFAGSYVKGMIVIDVSDPYNPVQLDEFPTFYTRAIAIKENRIYELDRGAGLIVYEYRRQ